ncbi:amidase domain-containing protein [Paramaledivibacter caminithermalis]|uniref:Putative amidase domain-containing protein n=1 Tax=Paramaledivibacter caminithermalis (strain DSM 15212 / CIP 107654 / DViRD3) TaxID=1121301 RepID=A0A1M6MZS7_PARC5|nr:amidase domain-containing protein [Paramaledivibacter caminithermalis]SHJ89005.1 Putative amidase domain-containing protein [Paramaledivibacter caminithermalis DSM 15212]
MKKFLSILLVLTLFMSLGVNFSSAVANEENKIKKVVENYFNTKYELQQKQNISNAKNLNAFFLKPNKNIYLNYETGRLKYFIESDIVSKTGIEYFDNKFDYIKMNIEGSNSSIELNLSTTIKYNYLDEPFNDVITHNMTLKKIKDKWYITEDKYIDEFKMLYDLQTDFDKIVPDIKEIYKKNTSKNKLNNRIEKDIIEVMSIPGDSYDSYSSSDREDAVEYARKYSENTGGYDSSSYNNSQFKYFSYKNDCQNFVSQCIWYGFGGRSSANKDYPMCSEWWADTNSTSTTWNWTGTSYFYDWITENYDDYINNHNTGYGVQGYPTTPSKIKKGDYVYVPGHVLFISKADDLDNDGVVEYNEIEICAHTSNRKDKNLAALYGSVQPSNMKFMHIVRVKWNEDMSLE